LELEKHISSHGLQRLTLIRAKVRESLAKLLPVLKNSLTIRYYCFSLSSFSSTCSFLKALISLVTVDLAMQNAKGCVLANILAVSPQSLLSYGERTIQICPSFHFRFPWLYSTQNCSTLDERFVFLNACHITSRSTTHQSSRQDSGTNVPLRITIHTAKSRTPIEFKEYFFAVDVLGSIWGCAPEPFCWNDFKRRNSC
jgi:hypothetical protein